MLSYLRCGGVCKAVVWFGEYTVCVNPSVLLWSRLVSYILVDVIAVLVIYSWFYIFSSPELTIPIFSLSSLPYFSGLTSVFPRFCHALFKCHDL